MKQILAIVIAIGIAITAFIYNAADDNPVKQAVISTRYPAPEVAPTPEPKVAPEVARTLTMDDSPEVNNHEYDWALHIIDECHPTIKADLKEALDNDGSLRETEYYEILGRCVEWSNSLMGSAKAKLREFVQ